MFKFAGLVDVNNRFSERTISKICESFSDNSDVVFHFAKISAH